MVKKQLNGFVEFIKEQGVVALAVGLILGVAAKEVVDSFVKGFVDPLIGVLLPNVDSLAEAKFNIGQQEFLWGQFVSTTISFLVVAAIVYFLISKLAKVLDKKKD